MSCVPALRAGEKESETQSRIDRVIQDAMLPSVVGYNKENMRLMGSETFFFCETIAGIYKSKDKRCH